MSAPSTARRTTVARRKKAKEPEEQAVTTTEPEDALLDEDGGEPIPQDTLVCALTGDFRPDKPEERVLQSLVEQLHREYRVELADMDRASGFPVSTPRARRRRSRSASRCTSMASPTSWRTSSGLC